MDLAAVFDDVESRVESIAFSGCAVRLTARKLGFFICFPFFTVLVLSRAVLAMMDESLVLQVPSIFSMSRILPFCFSATLLRALWNS